MAERKPGPVKPPVIDLKAREASEAVADEEAKAGAAAPRRAAGKTSAASGDSAARPASPEAAPPRAAATEPEPEHKPRTQVPQEPPSPPPPPRPPARLAMPWSAISIAAGAGAVLGAGLTYLLANWIALPQQPPPFEDPASAIAALEQRANGHETRLGAVEDTARDTRASLDEALLQLDSTASALRQSLGEVRAAIPDAQPPVDLGPIEEQLRTLEGRVAAIGAGASSGDASALAESLAAIQETLTSLEGRVDALDRGLTTTGGTVETLRAEMEAAKAAISAQTKTLGGADIGPAVRLPLIVSGLETAFSTGRPFVAELGGLQALLPDLAVPENLAAHAETGLARPDVLVSGFREAVPDILAGRTGEGTGDWAQDAIEWAKALLALRPAEEMEGSAPEAIVSRLESAMERRDFVAAAALLAQLPAPMRQAAGQVGTDIAALAQAEEFVADLRAQALTPAVEPGN